MSPAPLTVYPEDIHTFVYPAAIYATRFKAKETAFIEEDAQMQARAAGKRFVRLFDLVIDTTTGLVVFCPVQTLLERLPFGWTAGYTFVPSPT